MNRIILAYSHHNAGLAQHIDSQLSRIGIPFEHASERLPGELASQISGSGEPALLLITDNFLKDRACMTGMLAAIQSLSADQPLLVVVADGVSEDGQPIPTHIDRMVNALQYMNFWQNAWLDISTQYQQAEGIEKQVYEAELDAVRTIANQVGDFISLLRDRGYISKEQLESEDYVIFFAKFGLSDWHGQYRRLVAQMSDSKEHTETAHLPEMPLSSGLLAPEPMEEETGMQELPPLPEPEAGDSFSAADIQYEQESAPQETLEAEDDITDNSTVIEQAMRDAQFWLDKGHVDRGIELLQLASEQYPEDEQLSDAYHAARAKYQPEAELSVEPNPEPVSVETVQETPAAEGSNEAKSYDLMGDMAVGKGDFLFAKYCWDRVAELDPAFPNIYRKLGLMTSEHLQDYRETAVHYLNKALESNPQDAEVYITLAQHSLQNNAKEDAQAWYERAVDIDASYRTPDNDEQYLIQQTMASEPEQEVPSIVEPEAPAEQPQEVPEVAPVVETPAKSAGPLVLITGATSGIGKATAEIFAQNGYRLILTGRRVDRLIALKNGFEADYNSDVLILPFDVRDAGAVEAALSNLPDNFRQIDILVNNAGLAKGFAPIQEGSLQHWDTMIDTNVKGLVYVSRIVAQGMVQRRSGQIINVGSIAGREVYPNGNVYSASKAAVDALTKGMRYDLFTHNIRVGQVSPGHVEETEFAINRFDGDAEKAKIYNDFQPLKSSDVADSIFYMATRPPHVNIQDIYMFATQQASATAVNRNGRES